LREVRIKIGSEDLALTESLYGPGESGPGPHVHHEHSDSFWVLEGELVFEIAGERSVVRSGGFVSVPPDVVHTFRNEGPADARFINLHTPGKGFDEYLRAMARGEEDADERFDTFDPPEDGGRPASEATVSEPGEGEEV
jgi:mannose-6-phosphate isomerase-like protein (cupin superfamily)